MISVMVVFAIMAAISSVMCIAKAVYERDYSSALGWFNAVLWIIIWVLEVYKK